MSKKPDYAAMGFEELVVAGAKEALAIAQGAAAARRIRVPVTQRKAKVVPPPAYGANRVRSVRQRMGLSQPIFARTLNVSVQTVRGWEQDVRRPDGATARLLEIAETHPEVLLVRVRSSKKK
jgi:putative transcriptional regulator